MNKTNRILLLCLALCACLTALAQQYPAEQRAFQDAAGSGSILFRGKQAKAYDRPANGNPYWSSAAFVPGEIVFEGNHYDDILVNIDAVEGKALVRRADNPVAVALPPDAVTAIHTQDAAYVGLGQDSGGLAAGFYEVIGEGPVKVYKHVTKRIQSSTQNVNGDPIGYYDPDYNPSHTYYYAISKAYYLVDASGNASRIRNKKSILRSFPEQRKNLRKALADARLDMPGTSFEDYCKAVLSIVSR